MPRHSAIDRSIAEELLKGRLWKVEVSLEKFFYRVRNATRQKRQFRKAHDTYYYLPLTDFA